MNDKQKKRPGRPALTGEKLEQTLDEIFRKIEPYLKRGLSVNKACNKAQISKSTVYDYIRKNDNFSERVRRAQQFLSVMLSITLARELYEITRRQNSGEKLTRDDIRFLWWFALNSNCTREEFGRRGNIGIYGFDPEAEIQRIAAMIDNAAFNAKEV